MENKKRKNKKTDFKKMKRTEKYKKEHISFQFK